MHNNKQAEATSAKINAIRNAAGNPLHTCPTCGHTPAGPYRRVAEGKIVEGCIDAIHQGHLIGGSADWHNRPKAREMRRATLANLLR